MVQSEIYKKSLDINVNLWWGLVMLAFGLAMFYFGRRADRTRAGRQKRTASIRAAALIVRSRQAGHLQRISPAENAAKRRVIAVPSDYKRR